MKLTFLIFALTVLTVSLNAQNPRRSIAVTIDDLPVVVKNSDLEMRREITKKLLKHVEKARVPAVGFVNEGKLYKDGKRVEAEIDLLRQWVRRGLELGNHTYSHMSLHDNPLDLYKTDILNGEIITKELLAENGSKLRYFRHPYLWTGLSLEIKSDLGKFLDEHNYSIAPVTIDNSDWIFARAYDNAIEKNDKDLKKRVGEAYVPYLIEKTEYWERQSIKLFDREIKQILLLHANSINADYFGDVAKALKLRGYDFITLEEALKDQAYLLPDNFVKRNGISWLHRWAIDKGKEFIVPNEPKVAEFVLKAAEMDSE